MNKRQDIVYGMGFLGFISLYSCLNIKKKSKDIGDDYEHSILTEAFRVGDHSVSIMEMALPFHLSIKMNEIQKKFKRGIQNNSIWFNDYIRFHQKPGEQLPWNEKFGISKDEYRDMISSVDSMILQKKKKTSIRIKKDTYGMLIVEKNDDLPYLSEIKIDTVNNSIITEAGIFNFHNNVVASDNQKVTGGWNGAIWRINFENIDDINNIDRSKTYGAIDFRIGRLEKSDQIMINYREKVIQNGYSHKGKEIIVIE